MSAAEHTPDGAHTPGGAVDPFTGEQLLEAGKTAGRMVIRPMMQRAGLLRFWEDVLGETVAGAWQSRYSFDPAIGSLQAWVNRIGHNQAVTRIHAEVNKHGDLLPERPSGDGESGYTVEEQLANAASRVWEHRDQYGDPAVETAEALAVESWLQPILGTASAVMDQEVFIHGLATHLHFHTDTKQAAAAFGISEARVREFKRTLELYCQVILNAWHKHAELQGKPARVRDLISCLPEIGVAGSWTTKMARAIASYPGSWQKIPVSHVQEQTGWTYNTARQYLATTVRLLSVAWGVIDGTVPIELRRATDEEHPRVREEKAA
ncbi:sigma factor [Nesterenkonia alkaliphila]|uniref:RNA polymerase sigma-70 region 2 domain-containing protein n=1 Tax=Nesterenkonia alkaliphila TaxID=1463631 RepID=A0A7K1UH31_9MICC|nr:sigma factor [Nesterenkonia alkaliphila]MVT25714.1 hypothetical protein [Nesterenkonia alkaliphila]GFZ85292.1 hypothetical protein GCM10011359_13010 [Nesterenkonia alkaliphila]